MKHFVNTALALLLTAAGCSPGPTPPGSLPTLQLEITARPLTAELALTHDDRFRGLSGRAELADDRGMLFVFPDLGPRQFVMRECLIPIDIAFIDGGGRVLNTHQMTLEPPDTPEAQLTRYASAGHAMMALELNAGGLERYGLKPGVELALPLLELKRQAR